jgi:stress response protein YsnF
VSRPESAAPDRPFPGAHSQVPGAGRHDEPASAKARHLTLDASRMGSAQGWSVRVPVRAEQVHVSKQVVVRERVTVRRKAIGDVAHLEDEVRREVLDIDTASAVNVTRHNQHGLQARRPEG